MTQQQFPIVRQLSARVSETSTTILYNGTTVEGNVMHGQYVYYKYTFSYTDSELHSHNSNYNESRFTNTAMRTRSGRGNSNIWPVLPMLSHTVDRVISTVTDPYDPSDPMKNSIMMDLQSTAGDPDMFVSCSLAATGDDTGIPSKLRYHHNFSSEHFYDDVLPISAMNPLNCARAGRSGVFYIAIYGFSQGQSEYSLTVTKYGGLRTVIAGLPEKGRVLSGLGVSYRFQLPDVNAQEVTIIVTPTLGDVDLYVKLGVKTPAHLSDAEGSADINESSRYSADNSYDPASRSSYDYKSSGMGNGAEIVVVSESDMAACAANHCWVSILVDGYTTADFTLLVTLADTTVQLVDSIPQYSSVAKVSEWLSYVFF